MKTVELYARVRYAALIEGGGVERKIHFFAMDLPHSDAIFVVGCPAETTEAFCDGHVRAFAFFDGVPRSILYDNTKIAVARILGNGKRLRTRVFSELESHYLFTDWFGRPGKGNDKGKVEGLVGYARRNFLVLIPVFADFDALNAHLLEGCRKRLADRLRGRDGTIGERLEHDLAAFQKPLAASYDACDKKPGSVKCPCQKESDASMIVLGMDEERIHEPGRDAANANQRAAQNDVAYWRLSRHRPCDLSLIHI